MKKVILSLVIVASILTACKSEKKVEVKKAVEVAVNVDALNNLDTTTSVLNWEGNKPTGSHNGTVALKSGGLLIENGKLTQGIFVLDLTTIKVLDIPAEEESNGKLVGHLNSSDFFNVEKYPTAKFVITNVVETEGKLAVTGNLQIKDITKSITIPATISTENGITTFKSEAFNVDRTDFGVTYKSKKIDAALKDKFINDLMKFSFVVKTKA